ncbi:hypothetical protein ACSAZL_20595 [Methanosarcina sp. T3]|uniref:hypothetical protein n=1 Tax=Methanosarcina sp. T3 TaxID=3439062 RepID=UPI003F8644E1
MSFKGRGIFQDERAATVVFGTLLIILVTITVVSALALSISVAQKNAMDRQSAIEASENENLKIVSIQPTASDYPLYSSYWDSLNITVLNLDILDSRVSAVSINGNYMMNYCLIDENREPFLISGTDYPMTFDSRRRAEIPAGKARQIHIGGIHTSENITPLSSSPVNVSLNNLPDKAYSDFSYLVRVYNSTASFNYGSDFTVDENSSILTLLNDSIVPGTNYTVEYTTFLGGNMGPMQVSKNDPITVEIISDRINVYKKMFVPPIPLAEVQYKSELRPNGSVDQYLLFDASDSYDPDSDGFITGYRWAIYNGTGAKVYGFDEGDAPLRGIKVRPALNLLDTPFTIDLEVTDDTGMVSKLSETSGNITIP